MTRVVFLQPDGAKNEVSAENGQSLMQAATAGLIPGIVAEGGGELICATCHVYVEPEWSGLLPARSEVEEEMLEVTAEEPTEYSRLSCQIRVTDELDGLTVRVPASQ